MEIVGDGLVDAVMDDVEGAAGGGRVKKGRAAGTGRGLSERDERLLGVLVAQRVLSYADVAVLLALHRQDRGGLGKGAAAVSEEVVAQIQRGEVPQALRFLTLPSNVSRVTRKWIAEGVARREYRLQGIGPVVVPTQAAASLMGVERVSTPGVGVLEHAVAINRLRWVVEASTVLRWVPESELARQNGPGHRHVPDGLLVTEAGAHVAAVEVERSAKGPKRLGPLLQALLRDYPQVLYVCASEGVADGVRRALVGAVQREADRDRLLVMVEGERLPDSLWGRFAVGRLEQPEPVLPRVSIFQ